jgi:cytochrome c-type biogenesis protein CcmF
MGTLGTSTIYILLLLATWSGALALVGARRRSRSLVYGAQVATYATAAAATVAILLLAYAFAISDFSLVFVQQHSEHSMPLFYRITALWGGMEGSLLLWTWLLACFAALSIRSNQERLQEMIPYAIVVLMTILVFFCVLLITSSNPFSEYLAAAPRTGKGLNPLLQNAYMVTHPPALYLGFVGWAIPFAFAMAALLSGQTDDAWLDAVRPWSILAWFFLTLGLVLGMLWAYEELGWGGYWGWDPVENAGLLPWLTGTAFIHSVMVQERRQMLKTWNVILAMITFVLTIFGTFLTRSGFIDSVHAFARSNIGYVFLGFIVLTLVIGFTIIFTHRHLLRSRGHLESVLSREFWFLLNNWVLLTAALLVLVLTIFPNLSALWGDKVTISIPAFNRWMVPVGFALLVLTGVGPMLGWRKSTLQGLRRQFAAPAVAAIVTGVVLYFVLAVPFGLSLVAWSICSFVTTTVVQELVRGTIMRSKAAQISIALAFFSLIWRNRRRYGGYVVHFGIVLMYVGFAGEAFKIEKEAMMRPGQQMEVGRYTVQFDGLTQSYDDLKEELTARMSVLAGGKFIAEIHPARWTFFKHKEMPTTEVALRRSMMEDLFIALGDVQKDGSAASFKLIVNPLFNWIWVGFLVLCLGTFIAAVSFGRRKRAAAATTTVLLLVALLGASNRAWAGEQPAATHDHSQGEVLITDAEREFFAKFVCLCGSCPKLLLSKCACGFADRERQAIRAKIQQGWDQQKITQWYMTGRGPEIGKPAFGAAALSEPPDTMVNRLSWLAPYALSGAAIVIIFLVGRRWARNRPRDVAQAHEASLSNRTDNGPPASQDPDSRAARTEGTAAKRDPYQELLEKELNKMGDG